MNDAPDTEALVKRLRDGPQGMMSHGGMERKYRALCDDAIDELRRLQGEIAAAHKWEQQAKATMAQLNEVSAAHMEDADALRAMLIIAAVALEDIRMAEGPITDAPPLLEQLDYCVKRANRALAAIREHGNE